MATQNLEFLNQEKISFFNYMNFMYELLPILHYFYSKIWEPGFFTLFFSSCIWQL